MTFTIGSSAAIVASVGNPFRGRGLPRPPSPGQGEHIVQKGKQAIEEMQRDAARRAKEAMDRQRATLKEYIEAQARELRERVEEAARLVRPDGMIQVDVVPVWLADP